jgi:hypothetical protein
MYKGGINKMSLEKEPWQIDNKAKVAAIARSMGQDIGKRFKTKTLRKIFPEKIIFDKKINKSVDIGLVCSEWMYSILTDLELTKKKQIAMIAVIILSYKNGINLDTYSSWLGYFAVAAAPSFSDKINKFAQIAKLSFMDKLEKEPKKDRINEGNEIQW